MQDYFEYQKSLPTSEGLIEGFEKRQDERMRWKEICDTESISFGDWVVAPSGAMSRKSITYHINESRLTEKNWISHLLEKTNVNMNEFLQAYWYALQRIGCDELYSKIY